MAQFKAISPKVEVNGETVLSVLDGLGVLKEAATAMLTKQGIVNPTPGKWYPQQAWLNAFKEIAERLGDKALYNIGLAIPENAKFPAEIDSLGKALPAIDVAYHMNHRNGDIGEYKFGRTGERSVEMCCKNPYPCAFDRGIIAAFCNRFLPKGSSVKATVAHDESAPCRKKGADSCTYRVTW